MGGSRGEKECPRQRELMCKDLKGKERTGW